MDPDEFDVPLSKLKTIPSIWRRKMKDLAEKLRTSTMSDDDWTALALVRITREQAVISWRKYLTAKYSPNPPLQPSLEGLGVLHHLWSVQRKLALIPLYLDNNKV